MGFEDGADHRERIAGADREAKSHFPGTSSEKRHVDSSASSGYAPRPMRQGKV